MNKKSIIAALVALLIGIGLGFFLSQTLSCEAPQPATASVSQDSATASEQVSLVQPAEKINTQEVDQKQEQTQELEQTSAGGNVSSGQSNEVQAGQADDSQEGLGGENLSSQAHDTQSPLASVVESGTYTSKDEVAAYIHSFGHLPSNFISKSKAKKAGWVSKQGNLDEVLPGMSIGGSEFYNDEGQLPDAPGRTWTECDINYEGGYRGAERIVFSNDGLIFYTADHYKTFEQLY